MASFHTVIAILSSLFIIISADTCLGPSVDAKTYSTSEAQLATRTAFIVEFTLSCKNGLKNLNLYADVEGNTFPAVRSSQTGKYQVSWSAAHEGVRSGQYDVRVYDEEAYTALRKAQRSGVNLDSVKPLTVITLEHKGVWRGPFVSSEFIAVTISLIVLYLAHSTKSTIQQ